MRTAQTDPIIAEVRAVRDAHAVRFGYDAAEVFRDIRAMQSVSGSECRFGYSVYIADYLK